MGADVDQHRKTLTSPQGRGPDIAPINSCRHSRTGRWLRKCKSPAGQSSATSADFFRAIVTCGRTRSEIYARPARPHSSCATNDRHAASENSSGLVGSGRGRRHPHRRARSAPRAASPAVPALSGPGPHYHHSAAAFAAPMLSISAIVWNSLRYSCRLCASQRTIRAFAKSLATYPLATVRCRLSSP